MRVSKPPHERRAELVSAARALFDKYGVEKTRVSDIVRRVGVAQGVFYYYFHSKDEIVQAVVAQVSREMEATLCAIRSDEAAPFCHKLAALIEVYLNLIDQFVADDEQQLPNLEEGEMGNMLLAAQGQKQLVDELVALVRQGAEEGDVQAAYPAETALVVVYGLRRYAEKRLPTRQMIYTIAEQALGLKNGSLTQCIPRTN